MIKVISLKIVSHENSDEEETYADQERMWLKM